MLYGYLSIWAFQTRLTYELTLAVIFIEIILSRFFYARIICTRVIEFNSRRVLHSHFDWNVFCKWHRVFQSALLHSGGFTMCPNVTPGSARFWTSALALRAMGWWCCKAPFMWLWKNIVPLSDDAECGKFFVSWYVWHSESVCDSKPDWRVRINVTSWAR